MRRSRSIFLAAALTILFDFASPRGLSAGPATEPEIWTPQWRSDAESVQLEGHDPKGPRALELFVWRDGTFERIADTRSDGRGYFDFGFWPVPSEALIVAATPPPHPPELGRRIWIERPLAAPLVSVSAAAGARAVSIHPAHPEGELRIFHPQTGALLDRIFLDAGAGAGANDVASIDFLARLGPNAPELVVVRQVLPDGRASEAAFVSLRE